MDATTLTALRKFADDLQSPAYIAPERSAKAAAALKELVEVYTRVERTLTRKELELNEVNTAVVEVLRTLTVTGRITEATRQTAIRQLAVKQHEISLKVNS